jgi:hypothetical protein
VNRLTAALLLTLLLQCAAVALAIWPAREQATISPEQALAPYSMEMIDELRIGDEFDNEAVLVRSGERWLLPDLEHLPADPEKVESLLQSISGQENNWPIARSPSSSQRFQVADYYYQRRLTLLTAGEELGVIYLGTSPGFRKVYARNENQSAIYGIAFNTFDAPAVSGLWLDPRLLQVRAPLRIDADLYNLKLENGVWRSGTGGTPDKQALAALLEALKTVQIEGVAKEGIQRELSAVEPDYILDIESLSGEVTLSITTLNEQHFIKNSKFPHFFKLSAYDFDRLTEIDSLRIAGEA